MVIATKTHLWHASYQKEVLLLCRQQAKHVPHTAEEVQQRLGLTSTTTDWRTSPSFGWPLLHQLHAQKTGAEHIHLRCCSTLYRIQITHVHWWSWHASNQKEVLLCCQQQGKHVLHTVEEVQQQSLELTSTTTVDTWGTSPSFCWPLMDKELVTLMYCTWMVVQGYRTHQYQAQLSCGVSYVRSSYTLFEIHRRKGRVTIHTHGTYNRDSSLTTMVPPATALHPPSLYRACARLRTAKNAGDLTFLLCARSYRFWIVYMHMWNHTTTARS